MKATVRISDLIEYEKKTNSLDD